MMLRQRFGIFLILFFLPINGPLLRMLMESRGIPLPMGELQFLGVSLVMFIAGLLMIFTPRVKLRSDSIE
jgi:hypothetical protein